MAFSRSHPLSLELCPIVLLLAPFFIIEHFLGIPQTAQGHVHFCKGDHLARVKIMTFHGHSPVLEVADHQDNSRRHDADLSSNFPRWAEQHNKVHHDIIADDQQKLRPEEIEPKEVAKESREDLSEHGILDQTEGQQEQEGVNGAGEKQQDLVVNSRKTHKLADRKIDNRTDGFKHAVYLAFVMIDCTKNGIHFNLLFMNLKPGHVT